MKIFVGLLSLLLLACLTFFYFRGYRSAFEADQACHAEKWSIYMDKANYDCDHDIETHQWILFQAGENHLASSVIKRYHY